MHQTPQAMKKIRILLADDHLVVRMGIASILSFENDIEVVGETETKAPERTVTIRSSQGDVVTEGEIIYLTSKLKGFDGLDIAYQWQVDRGDGAGWVDVEGANRSKHMFVADKETIQYSWRLIVTVMGEE